MRKISINKTLQQKVNDLLSQISVGNKVRFGSKSQKGIKKNTPVKDREKDKDDFDCTNGAAISSTSQADTTSADADPAPAEQTRKSYENRIGLKYQTMNADNRIVHESDVNLLPEGATIIKSVYESTYEQVSYIVQLYDLEEQYRLRHLAPGQIQQERQGEKTSKIITQIRQRLDKLLADGNGMRGDLMQKALNYLRSFWDQLFLYIKDGRYSIDRSALPLGLSKNSLAERTLRPMTVERKRSISDRLLPKGRKNSLTFGSHAGAKVSVIYHTFIETCKMCGVSTLEYFKEFFKAANKRVQFQMYLGNVEREQFRIISKAIMQGRTDYENMLPMTIGIKNTIKFYLT